VAVSRRVKTAEDARATEQEVTDTANMREAYETASAVAIAEAEPGEWFVVHDYDCDEDDDAEIACSCRPMWIKTGAEA
jgi:hypothetical protein